MSFASSLANLKKAGFDTRGLTRANYDTAVGQNAIPTGLSTTDPIAARMGWAAALRRGLASGQIRGNGSEQGRLSGIGAGGETFNPAQARGTGVAVNAGGATGRVRTFGQDDWNKYTADSDLSTLSTGDLYSRMMDSARRNGGMMDSRLKAAWEGRTARDEQGERDYRAMNIGSGGSGTGLNSGLVTSLKGAGSGTFSGPYRPTNSRRNF